MWIKTIISSLISTACLSSAYASGAYTGYSQATQSTYGGNMTLGVSEYQRPNAYNPENTSLISFSWANHTTRPSWFAKSTFGEEDYQVQLGHQLGKFNLLLDAGQGTAYSKSKNAFSSFDPYYLHGGSRQDYHFQGGILATPLHEGRNLEMGYYEIDAQGLETRRAHLLGFSGKNISHSYTQINLAGERAAQAYQLAWAARDYTVGFAALKNEAGSAIQQASLQWQGQQRDTFGISLQNAHSALTDDQNGWRLMFNYERPLGGINTRSVMRADDGASNTGSRATFNRAAIIGAGVVAAALVGSSGSSSQDSSSRKEAQHNAAREVLNNINPTSVRQNREHGGWIYRTPDGRYTYTKPVQGDVASVTLDPRTVPAGNTITATYHTHGGNDPRYLNEQFSPQDISSDRALGVDGYLGTPGGKFLWHDNANNQIHNLGTVAN